MRAILIRSHGDAEQLYLGEAPIPSVKENEVLAKVRATAVNRADLLQRQGAYPPPPGASPILGLEMSGEIVQVGKTAKNYKVGDRICALLSGGGYAEYVSVPADMILPIPENLNFEQAAAIPEVFLTAYQAMFYLADLKPGQKILIHAGASGVGTAAIQLAKQIKAEVFVTASKLKHDICYELGADTAIDYRKEDFEKIIMIRTAGEGVDAIVDCIGAPYLVQNLASLKNDGRLILLAFMGGNRIENFNLAVILRKRLQIKGSTLRARSLDYKIALTNDFRKMAWHLFQTEKLKPVIDCVFSWQQVIKAHQHMEANKNKGKIVLRID